MSFSSTVRSAVESFPVPVWCLGLALIAATMAFGLIALPAVLTMGTRFLAGPLILGTGIAMLCGLGIVLLGLFAPEIIGRSSATD